MCVIEIILYLEEIRHEYILMISIFKRARESEFFTVHTVCVHYRWVYAFKLEKEMLKHTHTHRVASQVAWLDRKLDWIIKILEKQMLSLFLSLLYSKKWIELKQLANILKKSCAHS